MKNIVNQLFLIIFLSSISYAQTDSSKCASFKASVKNIINQSGGINIEPNGEIDLHIQGGKKPYSIYILNTTPKDPVINWNSNTANNPVVCTFPIPCDTIVTRISVGTYTFYISDSIGCSLALETKVGKTNVIDCSKLKLKVDKIIKPFIDNNNGLLKVSANGGGYPYRYNWSNGVVKNQIDNLTQGNYSVTVIDTNNCQTMLNIPLENNVSTTNICQTLAVKYVNIVNPVKNNGVIEIDVQGGTIPYTIIWNYNNQILNYDNNLTKVENLANGYYEIDIIDSMNCKSKLVTYLYQDTIICKKFDVKISKIKNQDYKYFENNGSVEFDFIGGKLPIVNNFIFGVQDSPSKVTNLAPYDYSVTFTDANQCQKTVSFSINIDSTLCGNFTINISNVKLKNDSVLEKFEFIAHGGLEPYAYRWDANSVQGFTNTLSNLQFTKALNIDLMAFDSAGCVTELSKNFQFDSTICSNLKVDFDSNLTTSISDYSNCKGVLGLNIESEFAGVSILWSNYSRESKIENVCPGTYSVVVMDSNNCIKTVTKTISEITNTAGITLNSENLIKMYPNPCNEILNLEFNTNFGEIEIVDVTGKQILKQSFSNRSNLSVDSSILKSGTYILRLKTDFDISNHIFEKY